MTKNQPKNQHILPEIFLKGFTNKGSQIFMHDALRNTIKGPRNTNSVAKQKHIYTVIYGEDKNYKVEENFSKIESDVTPLLEKINNEGFINISKEDVIALIDFIALIFTRTKRATEIAENVMKSDDVLKEMQAIDPKAKIIATACGQSRGLSYAIVLPLLFKDRHKKLTENFDLILFTADEETPPFILNDTFSCLEMISLETHYNGKDVDWSKMNVKKHFPISNKHCLSFVPKRDKSKIGTQSLEYTIASISFEDVQIINWLTFNQKEQYAYCSEKEILEKYINYRALL